VLTSRDEGAEHPRQRRAAPPAAGGRSGGPADAAAAGSGLGGVGGRDWRSGRVGEWPGRGPEVGSD